MYMYGDTVAIVIIMVAMVIIYHHEIFIENRSTMYLYGNTGPLRISPDTKLPVAVASHCPQGSGLDSDNDNGDSDDDCLTVIPAWQRLCGAGHIQLLQPHLASKP